MHRPFKMDVKNCIFCGARPLSKEHIWSKWTYELFPQRSDWRHERVVFKSSPDDRIARLAANRSFQGDVSTVKVRAVCAEKCNNGWMSRLEARAKPVLTKLISGSACRLTTNDQELIAAWISMKVLVLEFGTSVGPISSAENRTRVMTHAVPPPRWHIWIAEALRVFEAFADADEHLLHQLGHAPSNFIGQLPGLNRMSPTGQRLRVAVDHAPLPTGLSRGAWCWCCTKPNSGDPVLCEMLPASLLSQKERLGHHVWKGLRTRSLSCWELAIYCSLSSAVTWLRTSHFPTTTGPVCAKYIP